MPRQNNKNSADIVGDVANLVSRFESIRANDATSANAQLREVRRLTSRLDTQLRQISTAFDNFSHLQRSLERIGLLDSGTNTSLPNILQNGTANQGGARPQRSQDEWTHLFSRLVASGFDNF